jgi:hypothetical protein
MKEWNRARTDEWMLLKIPQTVLKTSRISEKKEETVSEMGQIVDPIIVKINVVTPWIELRIVWKTVVIG